MVDSEGDAFFVAFASAKDAVGAAAAGQRALAEHDWPDGNEVRVRMGLHTGEPHAVDGRYVGLDVHHAARVMAVGHGGQVLVSETTRALLDDDTRLRDLGEHRLKDLSRPQRLYQLELDGLPNEFPPLATLDNRPTNLPAAAERLHRPRARAGRDARAAPAGRRAAADADRAGRHRQDPPCAPARGRRRSSEFANGVFFVSLAPIRDWELVVPTILRTLGLREQPGETALETLTEYLREKELLLLLDNFEHVFAAAPAVAGLLETAPALRAARHEPDAACAFEAERAHRVPQLALPDLRRPAVAEEVMDYESVRLFVHRARAAAVDFSVTDLNARPWRRSASGSTGCRLRSSSRRLGSGRLHLRRCCADSTSGSRC